MDEEKKVEGTPDTPEEENLEVPGKEKEEVPA